MIIGVSGKKRHGKNLIASIIQYLTEYPHSLNKTDHENRSFNSFVMDMGMGSWSKWEIKSWAYKIKQIACLVLNISMEELERMKENDEYLPEEWNRYITYTTKRNIFTEAPYLHIPEERITTRIFLQELGTDAMRDVIHPNFWVNGLMSEYKPKYKIGEVETVTRESIPVARGLWRYKTPNDPDIPEGSRNIMIDSPTYQFSRVVKEEKFPNWIIADTRFINEIDAIRKKNGLVIRVNRPSIESNDNHISETALDNYPAFDYVFNNDSTIENLILQVKAFLQQFKII